MIESERARVLAVLARKQPVLLALKVVPRASRTEITGILPDGSWRVRLASVPDKGKANDELRGFLADFLQVRKEQVHLVSGAASTHKRVRIQP